MNYDHVTLHFFWVVATQIFFLFIPKIGEDEPILTNIFWDGLVQPPTSFFDYIDIHEFFTSMNFTHVHMK